MLDSRPQAGFGTQQRGKSQLKPVQKENNQLKTGKIGAPQKQTRVPFADISNTKRNTNTGGSLKPQVSNTPMEKPVQKKPISQTPDIDLAYFSDEKIPYRLEAMEDFDVVALVSRPSIMKPYVSFDDNRNFELMHIDDSLYGTNIEMDDTMNFDGLDNFDFPGISFSDSEG